VRHRKADFTGRRVGVILSGGNLDRERLSDFLKRSAVH
jgi:threonine dehydratase